MRRFSESKLVIASHNAGKIEEMSDFLKPYGVTTQSAAELGLSDPEETGTTYEENALIKAKHASDVTGLPALGDDSGLEITAMPGQLGLNTARWQKQAGGREESYKKLEEILCDEKDRSAKVVSVLALCWPDGHYELIRGEVQGEIVFPPRGVMKFGFDPVIRPIGGDKTWAEMTPEEKSRVSHRAAAMKKLIEGCFG